jgi:hypothetical protein
MKMTVGEVREAVRKVILKYCEQSLEYKLPAEAEDKIPPEKREELNRYFIQHEMDSIARIKEAESMGLMFQEFAFGIPNARILLAAIVEAMTGVEMHDLEKEFRECRIPILQIVSPENVKSILKGMFPDAKI